MDFSFGHDDQILADPVGRAQTAGDSLLAPVSDDYYSGSTRFFLRWDDLWGSDRLEIIGHASGVSYGSKVDGGDTNLSMTGAYRRRLSNEVALDLSGAGFQFKRDEPTVGRPVFDFNLYRTEARLGWAADEAWLLTVGMKQDWISFPGRFAGFDSTRDETQSQFNLSVGAIRRFQSGGFVAGQMNYRWTRSNADLSEYEGPVFSMRARRNLTDAMDVSGYIAFGHRNYELDTLTVVARRDNTWQFGASLDRRLSPRFSLFLEGSFLHQDSNLDEFDFNQARAAIGISVNLLSARPWRSPSIPRPSATIAPTVDGRGSGVRFRYLDPDAGSVALVGGFNAWDATRNPLTGPDGDGVWELVLPLDPGVWRYGFVVDGVWMEPQEAPRYEEDGFGGRHGILEVPESKEVTPVTGGRENRQNQ